MKKLTFVLFIAIVSITIQNCKDEKPICNDPTNPKCPNYDPCYGKQPVTADFDMSEIYPFAMPEYVGDFNCDIAFARGRIGFKPIIIDTSATYTWLLGSEIIKESTFIRNFINTQHTGENNIPVTLIIEKDLEQICLTNDNGKDTITKYIRFVENPCEYLTSGDFKVRFAGDSDSTIVGIRNWHQPIAGSKKPIDDSCRYRRMVLLGFDHNITPNDTGWDGSSGFQFNSKIVFGSSEGGGTIGTAYNGFFKIEPLTHKVESEYEILQLDGKFSKRYKFKGRKIK